MESNSTEQNYRWGFTRLVVDFLAETIHLLEEPYIGKFNSPRAIGQLKNMLNKNARPLEESNVIYSYSADITMIDPTTARVVFQSDVAEPIWNIKNEIIIGNDLTIQDEK